MYIKFQQENSLKQLQMHTFGDNEGDTELKNISKKKKKTVSSVICESALVAVIKNLQLF